MKITKSEEHLYHKYPTQMQPQSTYIELDPDAETLRATWNGEIGNAVPFSVWHGTIRRYSLPSSELKTEAIGWFLDEIAPYAQRVCDGYSEEWDGSNYVGIINDDARDAEEVIYRILDDQWDEDGDCIQVRDAADWYQDERSDLIAKIASGATDEDLEKTIEEGALEIDVLENVEAFIRQLRDEHSDLEEAC